MFARHDRSRRLARLLPFAVVMASLPLLAPTCGNQLPGVKAFSQGSLIIPMDACYQNTPTTLTNGTYFAPYTGCPSSGTTASDRGNVIRAYGLVYQLLRNGIPVYWTINSQKAGLVDAAHPDVGIAFAGTGGPVGKYLWASDAVGSMPPNNASGTSISYQGGPFVVDGSDALEARRVMQGLGVTFRSVNVHVSKVAFTAEVARAMSGNFGNSGGANAPPIALLNITGGDGLNAEAVVQGYLEKAGLGASDFPGAGGTAVPGSHGSIYDDLYPADFLPVACNATTPCANGSPCTGGQCQPSLTRFGYTILWVPHWCGPESQGMPAGFTYANVLAAIRDYIAAGHDVMAECASIGTFEGTNNSTSCHTHLFDGFPAGSGTEPIHLQATAGMNINEGYNACSVAVGTMECSPPPLPPPATQADLRRELYEPSYYKSPFLQLGDFPFDAVDGAINTHRAAGASSYRAGVVPLISGLANATGQRTDLFTLLPAESPGGNVVYLSGHDYSGTQLGWPQIGGSRLVLNTLFNLGASCRPRTNPDGSAMACLQLKNEDACQAGSWQCCEAADITAGTCSVAGEPVCRPLPTSVPSPEICDGKDNNCDGLVDNIDPSDPHVANPGCYIDGATGLPPGGSPDAGICQGGSWVCQQSPAPHWACIGWVGPRTETCNGIDDDCNGTIDDGVAPPGGNPACYAAGGGCTVPAGGGSPVCAGCYQATPDSAYTCLGECAAGSWACQQPTGASGGVWVCNGQVGPSQEICAGVRKDYNCNGVVADGCACAPGTARPCRWPGPGTPGLGICRAGLETCSADGTWASCAGQVVGQPHEICGNGIDDDCNGTVDDPSACGICQAGDTRSCYPDGTAGCTGTPGSTYTCNGVCAAGRQSCVNGAWATCTGAVTPGPERCDGKENACAGGAADAGAPCPTGLACINGACTAPAAAGENACDSGYQPASGISGPCVPENCPATPCAAGTLCRNGTTCVDPCAQKVCAEGAYCTGGKCIGGSCYATGCTAPEVCRGGACQADVCSGATCPDGTFCRGNYALTPPIYDCVKLCATVTCAAGQACGSDGTCAAHPCATKDCASGQVCRNTGGTATCIADPCPAGACGTNQACVDGRCTDDPCAGVVCPVGACRNGQCYATSHPGDHGPSPVVEPPPPAARSPSKGGCGCGGGEAAPTALLLSLLALPLRRRPPSRARRPERRSERLAAGAFLAFALLLSGACTSDRRPTPAPAPAPTPPAGCETCGTAACVDLHLDAAHCGACTAACTTGQICVDSTCVASSPAIPVIRSVTPGPVAAYTTPLFRIAGERFQTGATVRVSGVVPAAVLASGVTVLSSAEIQATVDLAGAALGALRFQVANADHTVSNVVEVNVVAPTPVLSGIAPDTGLAGARLDVVASGSGFTRNAVCVFRVGTSDTVVPPAAPPTCTAGSCTMTCPLDLGWAAPGAAQLIVQDEHLVQSAPAPFTVTTATPAITSLSPNPAQQGAEVRLVVSGTGFAPGATVQVDRGSGFADLLTEFGAPTLVAAPLSLQDWAPGSYPVRVANPGIAPSPTLALTVDPSPPVATGLTVTPSAPRVGDPVQLDLSGSGFGSTCAVQVNAAGALAFDHPVTTASGTTPGAIRATLSLAGATAGTFHTRVTCTAGCTSPPCLTTALPFSVATNVATLASVTPAGGARGAGVPVTVTGSNFQPGMMLRLGTADTAATVASATQASATIDLSGASEGLHLLGAVNAGAAASNGIAFTVSAGAPTVTSVSTSCTAAGCTDACALQRAAPHDVATLTLTGTNFATGRSAVYAAFTLPSGTQKVNLADLLGAGAVTVPSATRIQVALDTLKVLPTDYAISVENPGQPAALLPPSNGYGYRVSATTCP